MQSDPDKYTSVTPTTSRPPRDGEQHGKVYFFVNRVQIEQDISDNKYLEHGEYQGHLYGTKLRSIRDVIEQGKIAVIDCNPQVPLF
jgi:guanylate kinase